MRERLNDIERLTDEIITLVNQKYPSNQDARLDVYETVADKLSGLVRALRGEIKPGEVEDEE